MSSPFSSALAKLDGSLQTVHSQLDCLEAGLDVNDDRLIRSLIDARQHAARLRDLVRAQRPNAKWNDREALRQLVHELELEIAVKARRNQQRRDKLIEVAGELEAGSIKHRFANRGTALNNLRLEAIAELRAEAGQSEEVKELPGPPASDWLHWAVGLQESKDAAPLASLRRDFPKLERFAGEMEESYWVPAEQREGSSAPTSPTTIIGETAAPQSQTGLAAATIVAPPQAPAVGGEFHRTANTTDYDQSHTLPYSRRSNGGSSPPEIVGSPASATPVQETAIPVRGGGGGGSAPTRQVEAVADMRFGAEPLAGSLQPSAAKSTVASAAVGILDNPSLDTAEEAADAEFARLKALLVQQKAESEAEVGLLDKIAEHKSRLIVWGSAVGVVLLVVLVVLVHSVIGTAARNLRASFVSARAHLTGKVVVPDADIQRELGQKLAVLKDSTIQATVEDGVVTLAGQCPSQWQSVTAESIASQISGVKQVNNMVAIQPPVEVEANPAKKPRLKTKK